MKLNYKILAGMILIVLMIVSCETDDLTGHSNFETIDGITISVTGPEESPVVTDESDTTFFYTVTLSEASNVDVVVWVSQIDGDALEDEDFIISSSKLVIAAYDTSATFDITVLADDITEDSETFTIQVGDDRTANADITPVVTTYTVDNATSGDLVIDLSWSVDLVYNDGTEVAAIDAANLRLLMVDDRPYTQVVLSEDGADVEQMVVEESHEDGTYYIVADFFGVADFDHAFDVDITATISQSGVIDPIELNYEAALNSSYICEGNNIYIAMVEKVGSTFVVTPDGSSGPDVITLPSEDEFAGTYSVTSSNGAFGLPILLASDYEITAESETTRSLDVTLYPGFGGFPNTITFSIGQCAVFQFDELNTELGCSAAGDIYFLPASPYFDGDLSDDSSFSLYVEEYDPFGCGLGGFNTTLTFTKL